MKNSREITAVRRDARHHAAKILAGVLLIAVLLSGLAPVANAVVIADSSADFSGVQGLHNWSYGYYNGHSATPYKPGDFVFLPTYGASVSGTSWHALEAPGGTWTLASAQQQHPNGPQTSGGRLSEEQWSVRRWVSPVAGHVQIAGSFNYVGTGTSDGTFDSLTVDNTTILSHHVTPANPGFSFSTTATVHVGSILDFAVAPGTTDYGDATNICVTISTVPEPSTLALAAFGFMGLAWGCRRKLRS